MSDDYERVKTWCNDPRKMPCAPYNSICRVFEDYDRLRAELETTKRCLLQAQNAAIDLNAQLSETCRLLDEAHRSIRTGLELFKSEPMDFDYYAGMIAVLKNHIAAPVPAQPAVPDDVAKDAIPPGWVFFSADASIQANDTRRPLTAMIRRDVDGLRWWLSLTDEEKERTPLYSTGAGMTLKLALDNAVAAILSATDTEVKK